MCVTVVFFVLFASQYAAVLFHWTWYENGAKISSHFVFVWESDDVILLRQTRPWISLNRIFLLKLTFVSIFGFALYNEPCLREAATWRSESDRCWKYASHAVDRRSLDVSLVSTATKAQVEYLTLALQVTYSSVRGP